MRLIRHLTKGALDRQSLRAAGALLGNELYRQRVEILQEIRSGIARLVFADDSGFQAGYVAALADVAAAFEVEIEADRAYDANLSEEAK